MKPANTPSTASSFGRRAAFAIVALAVAFSLGWWVARRSPPPSPSPASPGEPASTATAATSKSPANRDAATTLAGILAEKDPFTRVGHLYAFIGSLDLASTRALFKDLSKNPPSTNNYELRQALTQRLADLDPLGTLAQLNQISPSYQYSVLDAIVGVLSQQDPAKALALLRSLPVSKFTGRIYPDFFASWAAHDPVTASAAALNLPPSPSRSATLAKVASAWAAQDPAAAVAWVNNLPPDTTRNNTLNDVLIAVSAADPKAATAFLNVTTTAQQHDAFLQTIATDWGKTDPAAALAWMDQNTTGDVHDNAVVNVLKQAVLVDPANTPAYAAKLPNNASYEQNLGQLATAWENQDPVAALNWLQSLPPPADQNSNPSQYPPNLVQTAIGALSQTDPATAASYISALAAGNSTGSNFSGLVSRTAAQWAQTDPTAALAWSQQLPEGSTRDSAVGSILSTLSTYDPKTAWDNAQQLPDGSSRNAAISNILNNWSDQDPAQAAALLADLPAGKSANKAASQIAGNWAASDPAAAATWVNTLPQGAARDNAITGLVGTVATTDPQSAFTWASSIGNANSQFSLIQNVVQQWAAADPTAAAAAAQSYEQSANLTDQQAAALDSALQHPNRMAMMGAARMNMNMARFNQNSSAQGLRSLSGGNSMSTSASGNVTITTYSGTSNF